MTGTEGERRRAAAVAGHRGDEPGARALLADLSAAVRETAYGALARAGALTADDLASAGDDPEARVRARAAELAAAFDWSTAPADHAARGLLRRLLGDADARVVETAAWAAGEQVPPAAGTVESLIEVAGTHPDALCREAAVAALGALGDPAGLSAILAATDDKPAVRRRAVLALAPFDGPEVDEALRDALDDRDWQVRQAAEDLLAPPQL
jgi:HEAT repeat protein